MGARRLPAPLHPGADRGRPVRFTVDGRMLEGFEGEPIAAALLAAGRPVLSRSFRFHRPRGLMCSTGQCGWCECRVDGVPSVRTCRVAVREGVAIDGEHAWPSVRRDLLAGLDLGSRWIAPTFYHHRFLRPRGLRKRYLDVLRAFGGRGSLVPGGSPPNGWPVRRVTADVAVVGAGPAGLVAALAARETGASVVLLDADTSPGGPWRWRDEPLPGGGVLDGLLARLGDLGATIETGTVALTWDHGRLHAIGPDAHLEVHATSTVLAIGSYERLPVVPGNDRPGVMGARTVEWLVRELGIVPGQTAALVGDGPDIERASASLSAAGARVAMAMPTEALRAIEGRDRVRAVQFRANGGETSVEVELVVIGERTPALDLGLAGGVDVRWDDDVGIVPILDDDGRSGVPGLFVAGAAAGDPIESIDAVRRAETTGRAAAAGLPVDLAPGTASASRSTPRASHPRRPPADGAMVCFCEDVRVADLATERTAGYGDPELLKRRTGALTGPCQGKYCAASFCAATEVGDDGLADGLALPTGRPPARPVRLGDLVQDAGSTPPTPADA